MIPLRHPSSPVRTPFRVDSALLAFIAFGICHCEPAFSADDSKDIVPLDSAADADTFDAITRPLDAGVLDASISSDADASLDGGTDTDTDGDGAPEAPYMDVGPSDAVSAVADQFVCDPTQSPKDEPCVLADPYGIFVAPAIRDPDVQIIVLSADSGVDAADAGIGPFDGGDSAFDGGDGYGDGGDGEAPGTMANPVETIAEGLALAAQTGKSRLYICNSIYHGAVRIAAPVSLYGGLSCTPSATGRTWNWVGGAANVVANADLSVAMSFLALRVDVPGSAGIAIEDMNFTAQDGVGQDAAGNGVSSVAAFVNASTVTFSRCLFGAGRGAAGANGAMMPPNYAGMMAPGGVPGAGTPNVCVYSDVGAAPDSSTGGSGGIYVPNSTYDVAGSNGTSNPPPAMIVAVPPPGTMAYDGAGSDVGSADPGEDGVARPGGHKATTLGHLSSAGWVPSAGGNGPAGRPGQGGGGSPSLTACESDGTAGGAGGCGGSGGGGGGGGGGSVALISVASMVTVSDSTLITMPGGAGGNGADGQDGELGGEELPRDCGFDSGAGGNGAGGSGGAGGTGGISVGILYIGSQVPAVDLTTTSIAVGQAGTSGIGGKAGQGAGTAPPGNDGANGYVDLSAAGSSLLSL